MPENLAKTESDLESCADSSCSLWRSFDGILWRSECLQIEPIFGEAQVFAFGSPVEDPDGEWFSMMGATFEVDHWNSLPIPANDELRGGSGSGQSSKPKLESSNE